MSTSTGVLGSVNALKGSAAHFYFTETFHYIIRNSTSMTIFIVDCTSLVYFHSIMHPLSIIIVVKWYMLGYLCIYLHVHMQILKVVSTVETAF